MDAIERDIQEYVDSNGRCPFNEWLESMKDLKGRAKIRARLNRVRLGNFGDCDSVGEGVSELKIHYGPGYRVYFGQASSKLVVLLCGGDKGSQAADIKTAIEYWQDYKTRE